MEKPKESGQEGDRTRFTIRLPNEIHERIKSIAQRGGVTLNAQYQDAVRYFLEEIDREDYESTQQYWDDIYQLQQSEESGKSLSSDDLRYLKSEISKVIAKFREAIGEISKRLAIFESRYFTAKLYYDSGQKKFLDITLKELNSFSNQIDREKKLLAQAKYLFDFFNKIDPAKQYSYVAYDRGIPELTKSLNVSSRIDNYIKDNFDVTTQNLFESYELINKINEAYTDE